MANSVQGSYGAAVAGAIRGEMARRRVSQADLASQLGRSQLWVSRRLRGAVPLSVDDVDAIAGALGVPTAELLIRAA